MSGWETPEELQALDEVRKIVENPRRRDLAPGANLLLVLVVAQPEDVPRLILDGLAEALPTRLERIVTPGLGEVALDPVTHPPCNVATEGDSDASGRRVSRAVPQLLTISLAALDVPNRTRENRFPMTRERIGGVDHCGSGRCRVQRQRVKMRP